MTKGLFYIQTNYYYYQLLILFIPNVYFNSLYDMSKFLIFLVHLYTKKEENLGAINQLLIK